MNLDQMLPIFLDESQEQLADMESMLLSVEHSDTKAELVNAIFRAAHTIKGSAGMFGFDHIVTFTHAVENVLSKVREDKIQLLDKLIVLLLACCDHIGVMVVSAALHQTSGDEDMQQRAELLLMQLNAYLQADAHAMMLTNQVATIQSPDEFGGAQGLSEGFGMPCVQTGAGSARVMDAGTSAVDATVQSQRDDIKTGQWHVSLRFGSEALRDKGDPSAFIQHLSTFGIITSIAKIQHSKHDPEQTLSGTIMSGFDVELEGKVAELKPDNLFSFVSEDCRITIQPSPERIDKDVPVAEKPLETPARIGEILMQSGAITEQDLTAALKLQNDSASSRPIGAILIEQKMVNPESVAAALSRQRRSIEKQSSETPSSEMQSIRVSADKLDQLITMVGELIIAGAGVKLIACRTQNALLRDAVSKLTELVEDVRDSALQLRMIRIGTSFNRFQRVVHDLSRELGKEIRLHIDGEDTELDKTVVEKLGDPLMHLVRNAIDHGIESAGVRAERGKSAVGNIWLDACHDAGGIMISVSDDGAGLCKDRIVSKALERGLIAQDQRLTDEECYNLIFEPGFSTMEKVSNVSGRGVGMDVVRRNVTALRGCVNLQSSPGFGTMIQIRLPLTLAIIDGFLVEIGKSIFVVPLDVIDECIAFSDHSNHGYANLRGQVLPLIYLREVFGVEGNLKRRQNIVVLHHAGKKTGLVVDSLLGEFQTVIKPLGTLFEPSCCISGSTILGNGCVALILDIPALIHHCSHGKNKKNGDETIQSELQLL